MTKKSTATTPPAEALPGGEANRYLMKFKTSLCKKWSSTRMETLYEIFDLAAFLWALERKGEALAVAGSVAAAVPAPPPSKNGINYNVWCPATFSHALFVHLATDVWRERAEASRSALLRDAGIARTNPGFIADTIAEARQRGTAPAGHQSTKWESLGLARSLGALVLYHELAKAGDALFAVHMEETALLIPLLLARLQALLQAAK
jgi:hypothetical protein